MGNLTPTNKLSISVIPPSFASPFNFHQDYHHQQEREGLVFPSYVAKNNGESISYCKRSNFQNREYQLGLQQEDHCDVIVFNKVNCKAENIWKIIPPNEEIRLSEGNIIKLGEVEFEVKKLCRSFADFEEWDDNMNTQPSQLSMEQSINMVRSRNVAQSRMSKQNFLSTKKINQSVMSSIDQEGQFCRYCYGKDSLKSNPLLNLCICAGSVKYCHYLCMKNWISSRSKTSFSDCYQYFDYDLSCEVCKQKIERKVVHKGKKYVLYSQSIVHPPFVVISYRNQSSTRVKEYIVNFDYTKVVRIGRGASCDIRLKEQRIGGEHCQLILRSGQILLKNLNPAFGTFLLLDKQCSFSGVQNDVELMIGNHLVRIKEEEQGCYMNKQRKIKIVDI